MQRMNGSISILAAQTCQKQMEPAPEWFCQLFDGSLDKCKNATNYDGKVLVVCEATMQLLDAGTAPRKIFFIDSQATIRDLNSNTPTDCHSTIQCRTKITELTSYGWNEALPKGSKTFWSSPAIREPTQKPSKKQSRPNRLHDTQKNKEH
ncbi:uncharacterized protein TNCV_2581641 [Trichonephila clavipes]|nr:uncharacterized protein TNCV_2581641 [Trichonephila clavipes]